MPIEQHSSCTVFTGAGINVFRFAALRGMLKLESKGLKHSGGALRPRLAKEFGLKPRDSYEAFIAYCDSQLAIGKAQVSAGQ